jgi:hypothetical protein
MDMLNYPDMIITHYIYMYQNIIRYPINMYNYVPIKFF